jgi:hypothetical protein
VQAEEDIKALTADVEHQGGDEEEQAASSRARFYLAQTHEGMWRSAEVTVPESTFSESHLGAARQWYRASLVHYISGRIGNPQEAYVACWSLMKLPPYKEDEWALLALDSSWLDPHRYEVLTLFMNGCINPQYFGPIGGAAAAAAAARAVAAGMLGMRALALAMGAVILRDADDPVRIHFEFVPGREPERKPWTLFPDPNDQMNFFRTLSAFAYKPKIQYAAAHTLLLRAIQDPILSLNTKDTRLFATRCIETRSRAFPGQKDIPPHLVLASNA